MIIAIVFCLQRNPISNSSRLNLYSLITVHLGIYKSFVFLEKIRFGTCLFRDEGLVAPKYVLMFCVLCSEPSPEIYWDYVLKLKL